MRFSFLTNLFLLAFVIGVLIVLFQYTNVLDSGLTRSFSEGIQNIERIMHEAPPETQLSESEKERLKEVLEGQKSFPPFFCGSTYFPFVPGASWTYRVTSGSDTDITKVGIPSVENGVLFLDGRLMSREKWTNRTMVLCRDNRIRLTDLNFLLIFGRDRMVTTPCWKDQYNFTLPQDNYLVRANAWSEKGCLMHDILDENYREKQTEIKEDLEVKGKVLGEEDVGIPAGSWTAKKIELDLAGRQEISGDIKTVESVVNIWVAQGVGIVKATYQEKDINGKLGSKPPVVQELSGFQIPTDSDSKKTN